MCIFAFYKFKILNVAYFIAKRLATKQDHKSNTSTPIIKIAIAAIAISLIMMIVSIATGVGLQQKIRQKIAAFSGHIIISNFDDNQSQVSTSPISIHQDFYPKFKNIKGISHIQAIASKAAIIRTAKTFEGIVFKGVGSDYNFDNLKEYLVAGRLPSVTQNLNPEVLLSQYLATKLQLRVGDKFNTFFMKQGQNKLPNLRVFQICGIYNSGFQDFDSMFVIGDIRHIQKINHWQPDQVGSFEVFIDNFDDIQTKGQEIYSQTNSTLKTQTIVEKFSYIFEWLHLFDFNIIVILIIMILVATINMAVALLVLILERTQTIGLLKAIGANNWTVRKIFLYNAAYLIARGLFWGNTIAISLLMLQEYFGIIKLNPQNYYVNQAPVYIDFSYIFYLNLGTTAVCMLVLLLPSYVITKILPVKAIRFD